MRRGEVDRHRFQSPDKKRPVLILTRTEAIGHLNSVTVAPITSTVRGAPSEVMLSPDDGMPKTCVANLHNVLTVQQSDLGSYLTTLSVSAMADVDRALVFALGIGERAQNA